MVRNTRYFMLVVARFPMICVVFQWRNCYLNTDQGGDPSRCSWSLYAAKTIRRDDWRETYQTNLYEGGAMNGARKECGIF